MIRFRARRGHAPEKPADDPSGEIAFPRLYPDRRLVII
jgi:hypothetical protein